MQSSRSLTENGWKEERGDDLNPLVPINANKNLSIERQRQLLPIYAVSMDIQINCSI